MLIKLPYCAEKGPYLAELHHQVIDHLEPNQGALGQYV